MKNAITIRNLLTRLSSLFIILSALSAGTFGQAVLVSDAHTSQTAVNGNFGKQQTLTVSAKNTAYVKFEVATTLPAGTKADDIAKATARFYVSNVAVAGKLDLHTIMGEWDETTITANNAPQIGPPVLTTTQINNEAQDNYVMIDITDLVKQWLGNGTGPNGLPNYGFAFTPHPLDLNTPQLANIEFDSKENPHTSHDGVLSIQLKTSTTPAQSVITDATLVGDGTTTNPLGVAPGAITSAHLADGAVTADKIAAGSVTAAKIAVPLSLVSISPAFTLSVANTGSGPALTASGAINTSTQYNIDGSRVLAARADDLFVGVDAGMAQSPLVSGGNSFFGRSAGKQNITGSGNSFFGASSGLLNTGGNGNSFFGIGTGVLNTTGNYNSFFGGGAARNNTTGVDNSVFGSDSGLGNQTGNGNTFIGCNADFPPGTVNATGNNNILLGAYSELSPNISNAIAIGWRALVTQSNSLVLGSISGANFGTDTNIGIGTTAPKTKLHLARGRLYVDSFGQGIILKSSGGSCFELTVSNAGALTILATTCP